MRWDVLVCMEVAWRNIKAANRDWGRAESALEWMIGKTLTLLVHSEDIHILSLPPAGWSRMQCLLLQWPVLICPKANARGLRGQGMKLWTTGIVVLEKQAEEEAKESTTSWRRWKTGMDTGKERGRTKSQKEMFHWQEWWCFPWLSTPFHLFIADCSDSENV